MEDRTSQNRILWFFLACFIISIYLMGWLLSPFFSIIVLGAVVTGAFYPVYRKIASFEKIGPGMASFLTCMLIFFILFVPIVFFVGVLTQEAYELVQLARSPALSSFVTAHFTNSAMLERINPLLANIDIEITGEELKNTISDIGRVVGLFLYDQARAIASNTFSFLVNFFLMLLVIFFLLIDGPKLVRFLMDLSPLPEEQDERLIEKFSGMAGAILIGNGLCGVIQGLAGGTLFWIFGLQSAFLWGVIMALLAFLPIIGIGVVFVPTVIFLFLKGRIGTGLFFLIFYLLLSGGVEYILKPKVVGKRVQMHTLLVFLSIIGGLKLFGILGIIYGPLIATAFLTFTEIYHSSYQNLIEHSQP
ncbi:AI-2E family transporter [Desulfosarcina widdelii]|uniref:AI-2E family transporter n=1 Tax=Desulfosarcina widdelii TaxID=947919 RepID=A0A5K7Z0U9_9BACT|nr:AI-2E family transporter [Desulfosarcina widdelii]BBO74528.1 AI-2E family transporter [Desulfosarcina widdelii]